MSRARVIVAGGGLAGLSAAVCCLDNGLDVTLVERRRCLGGATWSYQRAGLRVDNGQHVFLRCCTEYLDFLRRIGSADRVTLQRRLSIPILAPGGRRVWLRRDPLPAPLHMARSILGFAYLPPAARLRAALAARRMGAVDLDDPRVDDRSLGDWLDEQGQGDESSVRFWDLLVRATLNIPAREASLWLAAKVFQTGLLGRADAGDLGYPAVPLDRVHAEPAGRCLEQAGATIVTGAAIDAIEVADGLPPAVRFGGERRETDALIVAVPHQAAARLLPPAAGVDARDLRRLGGSPIVNLHVVFDRPVTSYEVFAGFDTPLQWVFDRTAAAGLTGGQYLVASLSAAGDWHRLGEAELRRRLLPEFARVLPAARRARVETFFASHEPAATFLQRPGTLRLRPPSRTAAPGLYLAGAWTDTGWPATMEGAVRSGRAAARAAMEDLARRPSRRRRAA